MLSNGIFAYSLEKFAFYAILMIKRFTYAKNVILYAGSLVREYKIHYMNKKRKNILMYVTGSITPSFYGE